MNELTEFEGKSVVAVGVEMPNAAGGLQDAMKFDPVEWHQGDEGYIVLRYRVNKVRFEPFARGETEPLRRVHVLYVDQAAPISEEIVGEYLKQEKERLEKAKEEAEGVQRLDLEGKNDDGDVVGFSRDELVEKSGADLKAICAGYDPPLSQAGSKEDLVQRILDNQ